jgi:hypothetical protein
MVHAARRLNAAETPQDWILLGKLLAISATPTPLDSFQRAFLGFRQRRPNEHYRRFGSSRKKTKDATGAKLSK